MQDKMFLLQNIVYSYCTGLTLLLVVTEGQLSPGGGGGHFIEHTVPMRENGFQTPPPKWCRADLRLTP